MDAPKPDFTKLGLGEPTALYPYRDRDGKLLHYIFRRDTQGGKDIRPLTYCQGPDGKSDWRWQASPEPRSLYCLGLLHAHPELPVLVVEGEKAADHAQAILQDTAVAITWPGGSNAVNKVNWTPLQGRRVYLWPDNDEAGFTAILAVINQTVNFDINGVVLPDSEWPKGHDVADIPNLTPYSLQQLIRSRAVTVDAFKQAAKERFGLGVDPAPIKAPAEPVVLVDLDTPEPLPLDVDDLPPVLAQFCPAVAEAMQVPLEMVAANALACVAVASQRKFKVQVNEGHIEPVNIYTLVSLPPGERKSPTAKECKQPLLDWEAEEQEKEKDSIRIAYSERKTLEKTIESKRTKAAHAKTNEDRRVIQNEINKLEIKLQEVPEPIRLLLGDVTPEALVGFMAKHSQKAGIIDTEGGLFDILAGRYSNGVDNLDAFLQCWSGDPINVDRKSGPPVSLRDPALTICLNIQPEVLRGLARKPGLYGRGLLARFLIWIPKSRAGSRKIVTDPVSPATRERYASRLRHILSLPWAKNEQVENVAHLLQLSPGARGVWIEFAQEVEKDLGSGGDLEQLQDWGNKLAGTVARLAGLFYLLGDELRNNNSISLETMEQAVSFAAKLIDHAKAAYQLMGADPDIECAKCILDWIRRLQPERFQARDALRAVRGRYQKQKQVDLGLAILVDRGFIFIEPVANKQERRAGRPSSIAYIVNPLTHGRAK